MKLHTLALEGDITIAAAAALRPELLCALAELGEAAAATLRLDLQRVESLDSAGIQLLLATRCSLAERGQQLELSNAQPAVRDTLRCVGLGQPGSALVLNAAAHGTHA